MGRLKDPYDMVWGGEAPVSLDIVVPIVIYKFCSRPTVNCTALPHKYIPFLTPGPEAKPGVETHFRIEI